MVYLLKMVIFHSYVSHNQMVSSDAGFSFSVVFGCLWRGIVSALHPSLAGRHSVVVPEDLMVQSPNSVGHSQVTWLIVIRPIIRTGYTNPIIYTD